MIKVENYGAGVRWHCTDCDITKNEYGLSTINWTNSKPPAECTRCEEPSTMVCWNGGRPAFVSMVMPKRDAVRMQLIMGEGSVCGAERGRELKRQLTGG